jgi:hypothetical protein
MASRASQASQASAKPNTDTTSYPNCRSISCRVQSKEESYEIDRIRFAMGLRRT